MSNKEQLEAKRRFLFLDVFHRLRASRNRDSESE